MNHVINKDKFVPPPYDVESPPALNQNLYQHKKEKPNPMRYSTKTTEETQFLTGNVA